MNKTKKCCKCKKDKNIEDFSINKGRKDGINGQCRECHSIYRKKHYSDFSEREKARVRARKKKIRERVTLLKKGLKCLDCGNEDYRVLDFDHLRDKDLSISSACRDGWAWDRIEKEIKKCEVVCSNCHRIRTFDRNMAK